MRVGDCDVSFARTLSGAGESGDLMFWVTNGYEHEARSGMRNDRTQRSLRYCYDANAVRCNAMDKILYLIVDKITCNMS